jgi:DNA-binding winged helix-turn-helix (wHTH) protein/Tol biopolymer transport system component
MTVEARSPARPEDEILALRFGVFEMDMRSAELRRAGRLVRLQPQPFKVLALLAERPGEVVAREEIQSRVWPEGTFVDFEQSLNFCIRQIRAALGDSALHPRYVETLPRRGYRWVGGPVERVLPPATVHEWPRAVPDRSTGGDDLPPADAPFPPVEAHPPRGRTLGWALAAVALALLAAAVAYRLGGLGASPPRQPELQRVTFNRGAVTSARFGPEGEVVYAASWEGRPWDMHIVNTGALESRPLELGRGLIVAASASEVAFLREGVLQRAPLAGGPPREVSKKILAADWTSDASTFAVVRHHEQALQLEYPIGQPLGRTHRVSRLRLSPDGERLALAEHPVVGDDRGQVVIVDRTGQRLAETGPWSSLDGLAWSPDGSEVWFTAARVGAKSELHALALDGSVRRIHAAMGRLVIHDIAPDGRVLLERTGLTAETFFQREGEAKELGLSWLHYSVAEGLSADASAVLLVESGDGGGPHYTSYLRPTDGTLPVKLGPGRGTSLSPDGQWVLMIPVESPDHVQIVPTGPGRSRDIEIPGGVTHVVAGWLHDSRTLYVTTRDAKGSWTTWLVDAEGGEPRALALPEGVMLYANTFSPDGRRFVTRCPDREGHCIYEIDGGEPQPLAGAQPEWHPVSWDRQDRVYFRDHRAQVAEDLWRVDVATGTPERVAELAPADPAGVMGLSRVVVSASGEGWAYSLMRRLSDLYVVTELQ